ncbi:MAG: PAS domain-containing sensor histidine kinase [Thalassobaculum sp.]|uniref:PAS domain-containing sensor histidine kinase n=1 Tax=Thalassobaculum sp. TaxID=2022740 RepID=UPI0032EF08BC
MLDSNYRSFFENANIGLYRVTPGRGVVRANPTLVALNGYASEAEMLRDLAENGNDWYVDPERRAEFYRQISETGRVEQFVSEVRRMTTGETMWISENAWAVRDADGNAIFYEGTVQDVTDRVNADRQLARARLQAESASQAKSTFLAVMSHELRSPLNAIIGFAEIIAGKLLGPSDPRYFEYAEDIRISGTHLLGLIGDILDLSKIGAGKMHLDERPVDLASVATRTARLFAANLSKAQVRLELAVPADFPPLLADPMRLGQILINLVSNAIKFTPPGGTVTIAAETRADGIAIRVVDTGVGMTPAEATRALEPFVQIGNGFDRSGSGGGTGLGLSICRELATLHGGRLTIDSVKGSGTTVVLHLSPDRALPRPAAG